MLFIVKFQVTTEFLGQLYKFKYRKKCTFICITSTRKRHFPMVHNFSRNPIMKHNHHIFPKWVILPRISYEDKLFSLKQEWRTKLFFLEREDICRVANTSLCAFLKYFLSPSGLIHTYNKLKQSKQKKTQLFI